METNRIHVLVVDDLADVAESTAEVLALWGYDATPCGGAPAGLACARARRPAAVLLDLVMPGMDGFRFARALHRLPGCAAVPLVAVSGYASPEWAARIRDAGIAHSFLKPADLDRLQTLLAEVTSPEPRSAGSGPGRRARAAALAVPAGHPG
jgi:CheY-like chemotaxis protein